MNFVLFFVRIICYTFLAVAALFAIIKACGLKSGKFVKTVFYLTLLVSISAIGLAILQYPTNSNEERALYYQDMTLILTFGIFSFLFKASALQIQWNISIQFYANSAQLQDADRQLDQMSKQVAAKEQTDG